MQELSSSSRVGVVKQIPIQSSVYSAKECRGGYIIIKWDGLLNIERIYHLKGEVGRRISCDCPNRHWTNNPCRHREIITSFYFLGRLGRGWFYDYDHKKWYLPISH